MIESSEHRGEKRHGQCKGTALLTDREFRLKRGEEAGSVQGAVLLTDTEFRLQRGEEAGSVQGDWTPH